MNTILQVRGKPLRDRLQPLSTFVFLWVPNRDEFLEDAVKQALEDRLLAEDIALSIQEADRGEYADDEEVKAFFDKWVRHEA
ncbi:MAG: hypothetical protein HQL67_08330 [Magnetococcales bacterium]|nr:hypothetical protein [Magnetococcales bacterium]